MKKLFKRLIVTTLIATLCIPLPANALADRTVYYSNASTGRPNIPEEAVIGIQNGDYYISEVSSEVRIVPGLISPSYGQGIYILPDLPEFNLAINYNGSQPFYVRTNPGSQISSITNSPATFTVNAMPDNLGITNMTIGKDWSNIRRVSYHSPGQFPAGSNLIIHSGAVGTPQNGIATSNVLGNFTRYTADGVRIQYNTYGTAVAPYLIRDVSYSYLPATNYVVVQKNPYSSNNMVAQDVINSIKSLDLDGKLVTVQNAVNTVNNTANQITATLAAKHQGVVFIPNSSDKVNKLSVLGLATNLSVSGIYASSDGNKYKVVFYDTPTNISQLNLN